MRFSTVLCRASHDPKKKTMKNRNLGSAPIVAINKFVNVSLQMLRRNRNVSPVNRPLQLRPEALDGVGVNVATHVFPFAVLHALMPVAFLASHKIGVVLIGHEVGTNPNVLPDNGHERGGLDVFHHHGADSALTFHHAGYGNLSTRHGPASLPVCLSAYVGFVGLNGAVKQVVPLLHKGADLFRYAPRRLISYAKVSLKLFCGDAVFRRAEKINGVKPAFEQRFGLVKNGARHGMYLVSAPLARIALAALYTIPLALFEAFRAGVVRAITALEKIIKAGFFIRKFLVELSDCMLFHTLIIAHFFRVVKG